ncbi:MAG: hypothetical protein KJ065_24315 [Anaerolineae bacterium]|nr:hypothetical protein [Anaerolineae bacterium]
MPDARSIGLAQQSLLEASCQNAHIIDQPPSGGLPTTSPTVTLRVRS